MRYGLLIAVLGLLTACDKPEQFERVYEDSAKVIRQRNCEQGPCFAVVSHSTLDVKYLPLTQENHLKYAKTHGYDYIFRNNIISTLYVDEYAEKKVFQLGLYWQKIAALQEAMDEMRDGKRRYEWVLWLDADAIFTNFDTKLEDIIREHAGDIANPDIFFLASREPYMLINAGVLLFHNDSASRLMLKSISDAFPWYFRQMLPEQQAIQDYIAGFLVRTSPNDFRITPNMQRHYDPDLTIPGTKILTQRALNSFYRGWWPWASSDKEVWQPGDFIAHFAVVNDKNAEITRFVECLREKGGSDYEKSIQYKSCH